MAEETPGADSVAVGGESQISIKIGTSPNQQEIERRRNIVRQFFNDFWMSSDDKPGTFAERLNRAEDHINERLAARGETWQLDARMRSPSGRTREYAVASSIAKRSEVLLEPLIVSRVPQSKNGDRKDLPLETRKQFSHLHPNALKCRTCCARRQVRFACGYIAERALSRDIWLAAITTMMLNKYFAGWKADRKAHGASLAS